MDSSWTHSRTKHMTSSSIASWWKETSSSVFFIFFKCPGKTYFTFLIRLIFRCPFHLFEDIVRGNKFIIKFVTFGAFKSSYFLKTDFVSCHYCDLSDGRVTRGLCIQSIITERECLSLSFRILIPFIPFLVLFEHNAKYRW